MVLISEYMQRYVHMYGLIWYYRSVNITLLLFSCLKCCWMAANAYPSQIASVCALSSEQLGTIKCFRELAATPALKFFTLFSLHYVQWFFFPWFGLPAHVSNINACMCIYWTPNKKVHIICQKICSQSFLLCWILLQLKKNKKKSNFLYHEVKGGKFNSWA